MVIEQTDGSGIGPLLPEHIDTAAHPGNGPGQVHLPGLLQLGKILPGQLVGKPEALLLVQPILFQVLYVSIHPALGGKSRHQVHIG